MCHTFPRSKVALQYIHELIYRLGLQRKTHLCNQQRQNRPPDVYPRVSLSSGRIAMDIIAPLLATLPLSPSLFLSRYTPSSSERLPHVLGLPLSKEPGLTRPLTDQGSTCRLPLLPHLLWSPGEDLARGGGGSWGSGPPPPPFWGTSKLHKEGGGGERHVCARKNATL